MTEMRADADGWIRSGHVRYYGDLEPLIRDIDAIQPHPLNYNNGDVEEVVESIEDHGMYQAVKVQLSTGYIVAGNTTWMACKALGADVIPYTYLDCDDATAYKILLGDNEIARHAIPDPGLKQNLLDLIKEYDPGPLRGIGVTDAEYEALKALNDIPLDEDEFGSWPTLIVRLPPHIMAAYLGITKDADSDWKRIEMLLRMTGWGES